MTLALAGAIIHGDQQALTRLAFPGKGQEAVPGGVAFPGRTDFQELPAAVPDLRALQAGQQFAIKFLQDWVNRAPRGGAPGAWRLSLDGLPVDLRGRTAGRG